MKIRQMLTNFGYVIDNELAGCAHPDTYGDCGAALRDLSEEGIGAIVSVDESGVPLYLVAEHGFHYLHLPVEDFRPPTVEQAQDFVDFVRRERAEGRAVVVHCRGGYGRTGTMLACYLAAEGADPDDAVYNVRTRRPGSIETQEQLDFVRTFAKTVKKPAKPKRERRKKAR